jgi:hypothetical protein
MGAKYTALSTLRGGGVRNQSIEGNEFMSACFLNN